MTTCKPTRLYTSVSNNNSKVAGLLVPLRSFFLLYWAHRHPTITGSRCPSCPIVRDYLYKPYINMSWNQGIYLRQKGYGRSYKYSVINHNFSLFFHHTVSQSSSEKYSLTSLGTTTGFGFPTGRMRPCYKIDYTNYRRKKKVPTSGGVTTSSETPLSSFVYSLSGLIKLLSHYMPII